MLYILTLIKTTFNITMLNIVTPSIIMLNIVIMQSVIMPSAIMLSVIILNFTAPIKKVNHLFLGHWSFLNESSEFRQLFPGT
jgi:hypothetical protein